MSFLKIRDPTKRNQIVEEYLDLKKNIRGNLLSERTGEQQLQTDLSKNFKPITETQKAASKEITEELKPIKEGIESLPQAITFPAYPSIEAYKEPIEGEETFVRPYFLGDIAEKYLRKFVSNEEVVDRKWGIRDTGKGFYIGNKLVEVKDDNIIFEDDEEYEGTPGLWELIVSEEPKVFTEEDYKNYARIMLKSNALHRNNDPNDKNPKSNNKYKWTKILSDIWHHPKKYKVKGIVVIPSDTNALLERLDIACQPRSGSYGCWKRVSKYMRRIKKTRCFRCGDL